VNTVFGYCYDFLTTKKFYMEHTSTNFDLIRFLYSELPEERAIDVRQALISNLTSRKRYQILAKAKRMLPAVKFSPSRDSVNFIMQYSRNEAMAIC
jgi:hypothetical protein